jgi:hypothetical protein
MIEIASSFVFIVALVVPIVLTCIIIIVEPWLKQQGKRGVRKYLSFLIIPPDVTSLELDEDTTLNQMEKRNHLKSQLLVRLGFVYLIVILFLVCNLIAEFYYVVCDLLEHMGQSGTDLTRTWSSIVIYSPFLGGWLGSLPWYGQIPFPPLNSNIFHEPWNWRFFTLAFVDNPGFFPSTFAEMTQTSLMIGVIFLFPLILKSVRKSFVPSLFYLTSGMLIMTRSVFAGFGQAFRLLYFGETITYGIGNVTIAMEQIQSHVWNSIAWNLILTIGFFVVFLLMSYKLSKSFFPENHGVRKWFIVSIVAIFWISFAFNVVML